MRILFEIIKINVIYHWWFLYFWKNLGKWATENWEKKKTACCGHIVEEKYCPNCGQQNIKTRQQFHYLFTHFIEDFTHYDGQFWGTLKNLVFKPGKLTNTYLEGKRQKFVPPVKLYIFISFITFFLFAVFPPFSFNFEGKIVDGKEKKIALHRLTETSKQLDSIRKRENINGKDSVPISKVNALLKDSIKLNSLQNDFDMSKKLDDNLNTTVIRAGSHSIQQKLKTHLSMILSMFRLLINFSN